eukprot:3943285-Ditylum_brightwellii.AAC.1
MYIQVMNTCPISPHKAWLCYTTVYCLSMTYSLGTASLTTKQIGTLHTLITPQILPWMGYQQNFPKVVVYGSKYAGGIGYSHLQAYQLGAKVTGTMCHVQANTNLGKIVIVVQWAQMCASTSVPVLEQGTDISHLEGKWLQSMLQDLQAIGGKIHLINTWLVPTIRVNDKHLKGIFCTSRRIQQQQYSHLNYCCIYLNVTCLLDIAISDERYVKDNILNCTYPQSQNTNTT